MLKCFTGVRINAIKGTMEAFGTSSRTRKYGPSWNKSPMEYTEVKKKRTLLLAFFLLGFFFRLAYVYFISGNPYFETLVIDARSYHEKALEILGGKFIADRVFYQDPLYPYFLALVYKIFGQGQTPVLVIQALFGGMSAALVCRIGMFFGGPRAGILSGAMYFLYGPLVFHDGLIGKEGLGIFLLCAFLAITFAASESKKIYAWLFAGLSMGLCALFRGNILLFAPLLAFWVLLFARGRLKERALKCALLTVGTCLFVFPVTLHNWIAEKDFVLLTSQAGQNFYFGNNPKAKGSFQSPDRIRLVPEFEADDFRNEALRLSGKDHMKPSEVSRFWFGRGGRYILENPEHFFRLLGIKTAMFFNSYEISDNYNYYFAREQAPFLKLLVLPFGIMAPLGFAGLFTLWPRRRLFLLTFIFAAGYPASMILFHMASRYRLPATPLLAVLSALMILWLYDAAMMKKWIKALFACVCILSLTVFSFWPFEFVEKPVSKAFDAPYNAQGSAAFGEGDFEKAAMYYNKALSINPDYAVARFNLGNTYLSQKKYKDAISEFNLSLESDPYIVQAYNNLGILYLAFGKPGQALETFEKGVAHNPKQGMLYSGLGAVLVKLGRHAEAIAPLGKAIELSPQSALAHYNLASAFAGSDNAAGAWKHLEQANALDKSCSMKAQNDPEFRPLGLGPEIKKRLESPGNRD